MKNDNKKIWILAGAIVVAAVILAVALQPQQFRSGIMGGPSAPSGGAAPAPGQAAASSYTKAVALYANTRIQFDANCQATPNAPTYKTGTVVMLDNRSDFTRSISFGGRQYTIGADSYAIVKLTSAKLPVTWTVDCDTLQNVATIQLQR